MLSQGIRTLNGTCSLVMNENLLVRRMTIWVAKANRNTKNFHFKTAK